jgi:hypothetical protein
MKAKEIEGLMKLAVAFGNAYRRQQISSMMMIWKLFCIVVTVVVNRRIDLSYPCTCTPFPISKSSPSPTNF